MKLEKFADFVRERMVNSTLPPQVYMALGLAGETGETVEVVKKGHRPGKTVDLDHLRLELGDVAYYWTGLCLAYGFEPEDVLGTNKEKLLKRESAKGVPA
jgi:NTP pyrophosphatase (non-canonical NTP hydrolase)